MNTSASQALLDLVSGARPLANFEREKHAEEYCYIRENRSWIQAAGIQILHWESPEGDEFVLAKDVTRIADYITLLHAGLPTWEHQRKLGALFGYDADDVEEFAIAWHRGDIDCECSKCVGVFPAAEEGTVHSLHNMHI